MCAIVPKLGYAVKQRLLRDLRACRSGSLRVRYLIILNLSSGRGARQTAEILGTHNTTVYRVAERFKQRGVWGLLDGGEDNGITKLDEHYLDVLYRLVRSSPQEHGWLRPSLQHPILGQGLQESLNHRRP